MRARPRPLCSDFREGRCHPGGMGAVWNRASARFFTPRCFAQNDKSAVIPWCSLSFVILRSAATKDPARARDHRRRLHHPSCLPFEGRWQRRQALTERSRQVSCPPLGVRNRPVGREKVNWAEGPREAGLGYDSARHFFGLHDFGAPFCQTGCPPFVMTPQSRPAAVPAPLKGEPSGVGATHLAKAAPHVSS